MNQLPLMIPHFPHEEPEGYSYETKYITSDILSIWLHHDYHYIYNSGECVSTIWGFYNTKKKCYHAPLTSTKHGNKVEVSQTTPYSAMPRTLNPLENVLYV